MLDGQDTTSSNESTSGMEWGADTTSSAPQQAASSAAPEAAKPAAATQPDLIEYTAAGRVVKEPLDLVKKRASQGYHYAQEMEKFNKQKAEYDARVAKAAELESKWSPYEKFATENPGWNDHLKKSWENRHQALSDPDNPLSQEVAGLKSKLEEAVSAFQKLKEDHAKEQQDRKIKQEDDTFMNATKAIRDEYKEFDFDEADAEGKSLEYRVVEHAAQNGINSFRAAFRDFYHDQLLHKAAEKARADLGKAVQEKAKQGIVGYSAKAKLNTISTPRDTRSKSYGELTREALAEIRGS